MAEYLNVVNEKDEVIGSDLRRNIHASGKWHRGIHVLLFNSKGELFLPKRSKKKDLYAGRWECSLSGHVDPGEAYRDTAERELREELGIKNIELKRMGKFRMSYAPTDNMIVEIFECVYDGKMKINKKEIQDAMFCSLKEVEDEIKKDPEQFSTWFREIFRWYTKKPSSLIIME